MELGGLSFKQIRSDHISNMFRSKNESLEQILINAGLDPYDELNQRRLAFEFPDGFSFKDHEFRKKIIHLFNKHDFNSGAELDSLLRDKYIEHQKTVLKQELMYDYSLSELTATKVTNVISFFSSPFYFLFKPEFRSGKKSDKIKKRAVRNIYQAKAKNYLVRKHRWPEKITERLTKGLSLPSYMEKDFNYYIKHKKELKEDFFNIFSGGIYQAAKIASNNILRVTSHTLEIILASALIGNYPARFSNPTAKFLNIKRKNMTRINIAYDVIIGAIEYGPAYAMYKDISENNLFNGGPLIFDVMKLAGYTYYGIHVLTRAIQIPLRTYYNEVKNKHIASYATITSPNPLMTFYSLPPIIYDIVQTKKENKDNYEKNETGKNKKNAQIIPMIQTKNRL